MLDSGKKKVDQLHSVISNKELALAHTTEIKNKKSRTGDTQNHTCAMHLKTAWTQKANTGDSVKHTVKHSDKDKHKRHSETQGKHSIT